MASSPQSQPMRTRRLHSTHGAAAALFEEMSHAARTEGCSGALPASHVQQTRGSRHGCNGVEDPQPQPLYSAGVSPATMVNTMSTSPSGCNAMSQPSLLAPPSTSSAENPHFYVCHLGSRRAATGALRTHRERSDSVGRAAGSVPAPPFTSSPPSLWSDSPAAPAKATHRRVSHETGIINTDRHRLGPLLVSASRSPAPTSGLASALPELYVTTPPSMHSAPAPMTTAPAVAPVYLWHNKKSMTGATPLLLPHQPSDVASALALPAGFSTASTGRRQEAAASGFSAANTAPVATQTAAPTGKGLEEGTPHHTSDAVVTVLAGPLHPCSSPIFECTPGCNTAKAADEDAAQQSSSLAGRSTADGATTLAHGLTSICQQQRLANCLSSGGAAASHTPRATPLFSLVPPFRFARVEAGVYRGAYPVLRNFPFIRRLRLRTVVSLIPEPPTYDLKCFAEAEHIQLHHIRAERAKGEVQLLPSEVSEALQLIINKDMHPLYIHCLDGKHVTGLIVMALRKLLQWDAKVAHAEFQRFTREAQDEQAFIADYTGPLLVPPHLPAWLWGGSLYDAATGLQKRLPVTMRLRLTTAVPAGSGGGAAAVGGAAAAATGGGPANGLPVAAIAAASHNPKGPMRSASGDVRPQVTAPWMRVPHVEAVASDGQHYIDVDRLPVQPLSNESLPSTASPAGGVSHTQRSVTAMGGPIVGNSGRTGTPIVGLNLTRSSAHSSHSTSANSSIVGLPAAVAVVAAGGTVGAGAGNRCRGTTTGDAAQRVQRHTASSSIISDVALAKTAGASGLLDGRLGVHLWTSGLHVSSAAVGGSASNPGGGHMSSGTASVGGGGSVAPGGGAVVGVNGLVTISPSPPPVRTAKRSFSR